MNPFLGLSAAELEKLESEAMYVLALAKKELPWKEADSTTEEQLTFLGLQAMRDPPRPEAADAIATAEGAGIRVVMITGDNRLTAQAIGRKLGIGDRSIEAHEAEKECLPKSFVKECKTRTFSRVRHLRASNRSWNPFRRQAISWP